MARTHPDAVHDTQNSATWVDSQILIGGYLAAADPKFIRAAGIQCIVKMFADTDEYPGGRHRHPGVVYHVVDAEDRPDFDIRADLAPAVNFVIASVKDGKRVLIHCHAGISRSATIVLLYLMTYRGMPLADALRYLRSVRPQVNPNPGFMEHLATTDARIRAMGGYTKKGHICGTSTRLH